MKKEYNQSFFIFTKKIMIMMILYSCKSLNQTLDFHGPRKAQPSCKLSCKLSSPDCSANAVVKTKNSHSCKSHSLFSYHLSCICVSPYKPWPFFCVNQIKCLESVSKGQIKFRDCFAYPTPSNRVELCIL